MRFRPADSYVRMHRLVLLVIVVLLVGHAGASLHAQGSQATSVIRVGFYSNPPKLFRDERNEIAGFFPTVLSAIAAKEGWRIEYVPGTWSEGLARLESGQIDLMPDVAFSEERAELYRFSEETLLVNWGILYVHPGSGIAALTDLTAKRIAVMRGSIYTDGPNGIRDLLTGFEIAATFVEADDYAGVFQLIDAGKVDAGVVNRLFGALNEHAYRVEKTSILFSSQQLRFAASPLFVDGDYVLSRIDEEVRLMKSDQESVYYSSLTEMMAGGIPSGHHLPPWFGPLFGGLVGLVLVVAPGAVFFLRHGWKRRLAQFAVRYETLFSQAAAGITVEDMRTRSFVRVNKRFAEMLGYAVDELVELSSEAVTHSGDPVLGDPRLARAAEHKDDSVVLEKRYVCKDGSTLWASAAFSFLRNRRGEPRYGISVVQDITDRKRLQQEVEQHRRHLERLVAERTAELRQAHDELEQRVRERTQSLLESEEALRASEERFRKLFVRAPDAYFLLDLDGAFLDGNLAAEELARTPKNDLIGRSLFDFDMLRGEEDRRRAAMDLFENRHGQATGPTEYTLHRTDGTTVPVAIRSYPLTLNGRPSVLCIARDVSARVEAMQRLKEALKATVDALATIAEQRDPYTAGHQKRVTKLACAIAAKMNVPGERIDGLRIASLMHDIGKLTIPAEILSRPGRLTVNEFSLIKEHPVTAYRILENVDFPWPVSKIVLQHHERLDGTGYPRGLRGDEILLEAQILAVADVVEAMSSHRPYRPALGVEAALFEIKSKKGVLFNAGAVDACTRILTSGELSFDEEPSSGEDTPWRL